jgi:hypothetical protein
MAFYGTVNEANTFFSNRLFTYAWDNASVADRNKALQHATDLIDQFDYVGQKYAVAILYGTSTSPLTPTDAEVRAAELSQPLQFPRGEDADASSTIPTEIEQACYHIAKALLDGRNPELDLEALATKSTNYGDVRTQYDRTGNHLDHIQHMIPSPQAWHLLMPFLRRRNAFDVNRVN